MLVNSVLHGVDSLLKAGVPVVFDSVIGSAHQSLRDETPFFMALISKDK
jgi:hypothetical protein